MPIYDDSVTAFSGADEPGFERLFTFVDQEFNRLQGGYDAGIFYGALNQVRRYWDFLGMICGQHAETTLTYRKLHEIVMREAREATPGETSPMSPEQLELFRVYPRVDLEVQSFYLFAKIMLGAVSQLIAIYFGAASGCSLDSHDKFRKSYNSYASQKGLLEANELLVAIEHLQKTIIDHRDKQYEHFDSRHRPHVATSYQLTDEGEIIVGQSPIVYPDLRLPEPKTVN